MAFGLCGLALATSLLSEEYIMACCRAATQYLLFTGFRIKPNAPLLTINDIRWAAAVIKTTGVYGLMRLISATSEKPSSSGICTSLRMASNSRVLLSVTAV